jgi:16S rRNA (guanine527-N7)-methyltransferase
MLKERLEKEGLFLEETFYRNCDIFIKTLLNYSKTHNITRLRDKNKIEEAILDSVYPVKFLPDFQIAMDIGTGAGFPGLILSFAFEDKEFFLVEPIIKRSAFLHLIKSKCNLKNVTIINKRVEEIKPFKVDLITSRAVTETSALLELGKNFASKESVYLFYKGDESVKDIPKNIKDYEIYERDKRKYLIIKEAYDI